MLRLKNSLIFSLSFLCLLAGSDLRRLEAEEIRWATDVEQALDAAMAGNKPILMEFTAAWCVYCKRMEKTTFADPALAQRINNDFVAIRVDADENKDLVKELQIRGLPAVLVIAPDLTILERISGFQTTEAMSQKLERFRPTPPGKTVIVDSEAPKRPAAPGFAAPVNAAVQPGVSGTPASSMPQVDLFAGTPAAQPANPFELDLPASRRAQNSTVASGHAASEPGNRRTAENAPFHPVSKTTTTDGTPAIVRTETETVPAFRSLCLVSAVEDREIVKGSEEFALFYRGFLLNFRSAEHQARFSRSPDRYWPMLDGLCCVSLAESGRKVQGEVQFAAVFRKRVWFFTSEETLQTFLADPAEMVEEALEEF